MIRTLTLCITCSMLTLITYLWLEKSASSPEIMAQEGRFQNPILIPPTPNQGLEVRSNNIPNNLPATSMPYFQQYTPDELVNISVYEKVNRSVVNITTESVSQDLLFEYTSEGAGSGSVLDKNGNILTNYHVIRDAKQVNITLYDGSSYEATFVGADQINDIAIVKIDAKPDVLIPISWGDSTNLKVGQRVFAIGNPFGFERTLSVGIVSSLNRSLKLSGNRKTSSIIQIDASLNPGNSGGPLLDSQGNLIGINTAIASTSRAGQSAGVGFAVPVSLVKRVLPQLLKFGKVIRPELGITSVYQTDKGLMINRLIPGGPAEKAGLQGPQIVRQRRGPFVIEKVQRTAADLIISLDGKPIKNADELLDAVESHKPGDAVNLTIERDGKQFTVVVTLGTQES